MDTTRRSALTGALGAGMAAVVRPAAAAADPIGARASNWRALLASRTRELEQHFSLDADAPVPADVRDVARGAAALGIFKDWAEQPREAQGAAPMQDLLAHLLDELHTGLGTSRRLMQAWLDGEEDADGMALRGALAATRLGLRDLRGGGIRSPETESALARLEDTPDGPSLRRKCRRMVRQLARLDEIGREIAADPSTSGMLLAPSDHDLPEPPRRVIPRHRHPWSAGQLATALLLGLVMAGGGALFAMAWCNVICYGGPIVLALAGLALVGLGAWGIHRTALSAVADTHDANPHIPVATRPGWRLIGTRTLAVLGRGTGPLGFFPLSSRFGYQVVASGQIRTGESWWSSPAGSGVAAGAGAPVPGAPRGALVLRYRGETRVIGPSTWITPERNGYGRFGANVEPGTRLRGGYLVELLVYRRQ